MIAWVSSTSPSSYEERKRTVASALESGYADIVIREEDGELRRLGRFDAVTLKGSDLVIDGKVAGKLVEVRSAEDLRRASDLKGKVEFVAISAKDWKVIPLENLIAEFQGSGTRILAVATSPDEAKLFSETLEVGVDGVVMEPQSPAALRDFHLVLSRTLPSIQLTPAPVSRIVSLSLGDRVCVDTCSMLRVGEGMLVGSQSACLFLVQSESVESEYVASRPFRVNAGAVHAYVLGPDGKTRYLSEVRSGDELLAVDMQGNCRSVVVGRSKIERRPLLLVEVELDGRRYTTILQNAETIRLCTPEGSVSVSDLRKGQKVLVRLEEGGRHFGHSISETIVER